MSQRVNRRTFLHLIGGSLLGTAVAACAQATPAPQVVKETVVVEKEVTKVLEQTVAAPKANVPVTVIISANLLTQSSDIEEAMLYTIHLMEYNLRKQGQGVSVSYDPWPREGYETKLRMLTSSGEIGDHVVWGQWAPLHEKVQDGLLQPLDDLMAGMGVSLDEWVPKAQALMRYDKDTKEYGKGPVWVLPTMGNVGIAFVFYSKDMFDEAGEAYPTDTTTLAELEEKARRIAKPDKGIWGLLYRNDAHAYALDLSLTGPFGGSILDDEGKRCVLNSAECLRAYKEFYDVHHTTKISPTPADREYWACMFEDPPVRKLAMYRTLPAGAQPYMGREENADPAMGFCLSPSTYDASTNGRRGNYLDLNSYGISANAKHPQECMDVLYWFTNREGSTFAIKHGSTFPAPRQDVLDDPELPTMHPFPIAAAVARAFPDAVTSPTPANKRDTDINQIMQQRMAGLESGEAFPDQKFLDGVAAEIQQVLDKPPA